MSPPTIIDVARASNVSPSTVSLVISDHPRIPPTTKAKVRKKIQELNYRPNVLARSLANGHTKIIAVLLPPAENIFSDPFYIQALDGIYSAVRSKNYRIILEVAGEDFWKNKEYELLGRERLCEGVIFVGGIAREHKALASLVLNKKDGLPVCVVGEKLPFENGNNRQKLLGEKMIFISGDNLKGGYIATRYLIDMGHKRIGHIYGDLSVNSVRERLDGYRKALYDAGLKFDKNLVVCGRFKELDSYLATKNLIKREGKNITAIFAGNDVMAYGAIMAVKEMGFSVPENFSVIGMDDIPDSKDFDPPVTTIKYPVFAMGSQGATWLIEMIEKKRGLSTKNTTHNFSSVNSLDVALVIRKSVSLCQ